MKNRLCFLSLSFLIFIQINIIAQNTISDISNKIVVDWIPASILENFETEILGKPEIIVSPYGKAVQFDGIDDALILDEMPLAGLGSFTLEMIFKPEKESPFEQRIVHIGEVSADRVLLEIRAVDSLWYFDGFAASGKNKKAVIDSTLAHPLGEWHHVALIIEPEQISTFVNGKIELQEKYEFEPIMTGKSSLGMRLNKRSFYKGSIYKVRVTEGVLAPKMFMSR